MVDTMGRTHELGEDQIWRFSALLARVVVGVVPLKDFPAALEEHVGLDSERARKLALAVAQEFLWPISWKVRGVDELIRTLGGEIPKERPLPPAAEREPALVYPTALAPEGEKKAALLGGMLESAQSADVPPAPPPAPYGGPIPPAGVPVEDRFGSPKRTVARPGEVSKLLEQNILPESAESPRGE